MGGESCHRSTWFSAQPQRAGCRAQNDKPQREIQFWVWSSYEITSLLGLKFSHCPRQGLMGSQAPHVGMEASQCRAPAPSPQPPWCVQRANHRAKLRPEMQWETGKVKGNRQRLGNESYAGLVGLRGTLGLSPDTSPGPWEPLTKASGYTRILWPRERGRPSCYLASTSCCIQNLFSSCSSRNRNFGLSETAQWLSIDL